MLTTVGTRSSHKPSLLLSFHYAVKHSHVFESNCSVVVCVAAHRLIVMETLGYPVTHVEYKQADPCRHTVRKMGCLWNNSLHPDSNFQSITWWRHQMETFPRYWPFVWEIHRRIHHTKTSGAELWRFSYLCLNKRLSKQSRHRWFEMPSPSLWRHCNDI